MNLEKIKEITNGLGEIILTIDYTQTVEQIVAASGHDLDARIIAKTFPITTPLISRKKMDVVAKLFYFNYITSSDQVVSKMEKAGYRPAILVELLALEKSYPEILSQDYIRILALGHSVAGYPFSGRPVPILDRSGIEFLWFHYLWFTGPYFLAIKK